MASSSLAVASSPSLLHVATSPAPTSTGSLSGAGAGVGVGVGVRVGWGPVTTVVSVVELLVSSDSLMLWSGSMTANWVMVVSWQGAITVTVMVATCPGFRVPKSQVTSPNAGRKQVPWEEGTGLVVPASRASRTTTPAAGPSPRL